MGYGANTVANFILDKYYQEGKKIVPLSLMKLVYISHGVYLSITNKPLISERIEAWKYGPVIPDLYHDIKKFGTNPIKGFLEDDGDPADLKNDYQAVKAINDSYNFFKDWTSIDLSDICNRSGTPWDCVYNELGGRFLKNVKIPNSIIKDHFRTIYKKD